MSDELFRITVTNLLSAINEKLDRLLLGKQKECGPCPDHPEWAKDGCPWHRATSEWRDGQSNGGVHPVAYTRGSRNDV